MSVQAFEGAQIVQIKNDKDKGQKQVNKNKPQKAGKGKPEKVGQDNNGQKAHKSDNKQTKVDVNRPKQARWSNVDRVRISNEILQLRAPDGRDMRVLLSALPLVLLGSQVSFAHVPDAQLLTYRNCPPGLAKKDPPCVPPGLAKRGVTYEQWVAYDDDRLEALYLEQRDQYLDGNVALDDNSLLLSSDQIAALYGLQPAPSGSRYALIDGQPVLLNDQDYTSLLQINDLARVGNLPAGLRVAPTAALTQSELRQTYRLPELEPGYNYAVVNGELVTLEDSAFETLQLIRIARAVL
ncbi:hypothetical protein [Pseudosulfitobacter koreensis]|uniref:Uncharacterized protein n=1 Tax=Pseudosulfitobacter koreensis TaxID=2968472 RepID=A0ABT1YWL0_9RHOB|nr:hypothetical protein [Pseudosulfitobacter koreense]MCR8825273.1 hypothetical protein [Pseudosulfitobacter koreense]